MCVRLMTIFFPALLGRTEAGHALIENKKILILNGNSKNLLCELCGSHESSVCYSRGQTGARTKVDQTYNIEQHKRVLYFLYGRLKSLACMDNLQQHTESL